MVHDMRLAPLLACLALVPACGGDDDDTGGADASSGSDAGSTADAGPRRDGGGGDGDGGSAGDMCGGLVGLQCGDTQYCDWPDDSCGVGDSLGECKPRPIDCTNPDDEPVCGCNGRPYDNPCAAAMAGADVGDPSVCVSTSGAGAPAQAPPTRSL
jgi:hypothetical protein